MLTLSLLCLFAFCAGLIDSAVGGGGLVQIPAIFALLPTALPVNLLGTNKLASALGTSFAARSYLKRVRLPWAVILPAASAAFAMAFVGAAAVSLVPKSVLRPMVLVLMLLIGWYTLHKKDFGALHVPRGIGTREKVMALLFGAAIGFYDGLFGPGTGSFLIFLFIRYYGFDFIHASASAKLVNLATNIAALMFFIPAHHVLYRYAIPMGACNILGALTGSWLAIRQGTVFVRKLFLCLTGGLIIKLCYDLLA
ncbi:MAG: TSUP family transporter [Paludibacterium sp.]|uniref:sulfite exporter TauE/SafE family protein n=1 Tax=Paludibacterium sp. TaxID=1917523 RepID=UPI0025E26DF7|nr:TSUP family transporter [Paludibacterium sp.]MBV8046624.1 TSUP family transporter [Paludibacterium sp.]MBV8647647.1 TSUP family transporter [Paludibacterium sp.]